MAGLADGKEPLGNGFHGIFGVRACAAWIKM
jgi:hypothetical protein